MLRIRLQRTGRENLPTFRVVVAEHSKPVKGKYKEIVGYYLPRQNPSVLQYQAERIAHWIKHGAHPSNTLARLLKKHGFKEQGIDLEPFIESYTKKKKKGEQAPEAPAAAPASKPIEASKKPSEASEAKEASEAPKTNP